jgi:predicted ABC-type ATPase
VPDLFIIAGPNGAGKTSFAREYLSEHGMRAGRLMLAKIDNLIGAGVDLAIETTLATLTYAHKIPSWRRRDYNISLVYLRLNSVDESLDRVRRRVEAGGHNIPPEVIERRFHKSLHYFETIYKPIVDRWYVWESREGKFARIESSERP